MIIITFLFSLNIFVCTLFEKIFLFLLATFFFRMEGKLKAALGYSFVKAKRAASGGCISEGLIFDTDKGLIFVKKNNDAKVNIYISVVVVTLIKKIFLSS